MLLVSRGLTDGGIEWKMVFHREAVPFDIESEPRLSASKDELLSAFTYGREMSGAWHSTVYVLLSRIGEAVRVEGASLDIIVDRLLPQTFTHETLHHAIRRCLVEIGDGCGYEATVHEIDDHPW